MRIVRFPRCGVRQEGGAGVERGGSGVRDGRFAVSERPLAGTAGIIQTAEDEVN